MRLARRGKYPPPFLHRTRDPHKTKSPSSSFLQGLCHKTLRPGFSARISWVVSSLGSHASSRQRRFCLFLIEKPPRTIRQCSPSKSRIAYRSRSRKAACEMTTAQPPPIRPSRPRAQRAFNQLKSLAFHRAAVLAAFLSNRQSHTVLRSPPTAGRLLCGRRPWKVESPQ